MNALPHAHRAHCWSTSPEGHDLTCSCGWNSGWRRTPNEASAAWRAHAGLPDYRPDLHPSWCDEPYGEPCSEHFADVGTVTIAPGVVLLAELTGSGSGRGLVVTVRVLTVDGDLLHEAAVDLPAEVAR